MIIDPESLAPPRNGEAHFQLVQLGHAEGKLGYVWETRPGRPFDILTINLLVKVQTRTSWGTTLSLPCSNPRGCEVPQIDMDMSESSTTLAPTTLRQTHASSSRGAFAHSAPESDAHTNYLMGRLT